MYFGNACLFNKKPADMRRIGARGGRARARNLGPRRASPGASCLRTQPASRGNCGRSHPAHRCLVPMAGWCGASRGTVGGPAEGSVRVQNEVGCHDMRKKVIPFRPQTAASAPPVPPGRSRIVIHVGAQRYAIDLNCEASVLPPEAAPAATPAGVEELQVRAASSEMAYDGRTEELSLVPGTIF